MGNHSRMLAEARFPNVKSKISVAFGFGTAWRDRADGSTCMEVLQAFPREGH